MRMVQKPANKSAAAAEMPFRRLEMYSVTEDTKKNDVLQRERERQRVWGCDRETVYSSLHEICLFGQQVFCAVAFVDDVTARLLLAMYVYLHVIIRTVSERYG